MGISAYRFVFGLPVLCSRKTDEHIHTLRAYIRTRNSHIQLHALACMAYVAYYTYVHVYVHTHTYIRTYMHAYLLCFFGHKHYVYMCLHT